MIKNEPLGGVIMLGDIPMKVLGNLESGLRKEMDKSTDIKARFEELACTTKKSMDKQTLSLNEVLSSNNNNKEFMCLPNLNIVKNVNGTLYYAKITGFVGNPRVGNTTLLERTYKNDKWEIAPASSFWINAEYESIKNG